MNCLNCYYYFYVSQLYTNPLDSALVMEEIHEKWPKKVRDKIVHQPNVLGLTRNTTAAFDLGISQHRTNIEALTEISVLSKCTYLLHGLSAMSEAAVSRELSLLLLVHLDVHKLTLMLPLRCTSILGF